MRTKTRNLLIIAAGVILSALALGAVAAQDATSTAEPSPMSTTEATAMSATVAATAQPSMTQEATTEASTSASENAFLGVAIQDSTNGVTVEQVVPSSPAATAGLQVNDIITAINGTAVPTAEQAAALVKALRPGASVTIDLMRGGAKMTVTATLVSEPMQPQMNPPTNPQQAQPGNPGTQGRGNTLGFQYNPTDQSWTINTLSNTSPLYTDGLRQGDVIKTIDGKTYMPQTLVQYLRSLAQGAKITLSVERSGQAQDIQVNASDLTGLFGRFGVRPGQGGTLGQGGLPGQGGMFGQGNQGLGSQFFEFLYGSGSLGVTFQTIDPQLATQNKLTVTDGALVTAVQPGSGADKAGLKVNDVITAVDGDKVDQERTLRDRLLAYEAGDTVTLSVLRDGQSQDIQATLDKPAVPSVMGQMLPFFMNPRGFGGGFQGRGFGGGQNGARPFNNRPGQGMPQATPEATPNV